MSKIEWTEQTWNPIIGCSKISTGCKNCYAEKMAIRLASMALVKNESSSLDYYVDAINYLYGNKGWNGKTYIIKNALEKPLKRKKPTMYFVCSMGDLFHESVPFEWIDKVYEIISRCPQHTFQILTKRPEIMKEYYKSRQYGHFHNVWIGTTTENQEMANERIPILLRIPAKVHFVSVEPMLSEINLNQIAFSKFQSWLNGNDAYGLDWVICGGESGHNARPMHPDWVRSLRDQCKDANVPFFFKQGSQNNWSDYKNIDSFPDDLKIRQYPNL